MTCGSLGFGGGGFGGGGFGGGEGGGGEGGGDALGFGGGVLFCSMASLASFARGGV